MSQDLVGKLSVPDAQAAKPRDRVFHWGYSAVGAVEAYGPSRLNVDTSRVREALSPRHMPQQQDCRHVGHESLRGTFAA